MPRAERGPSRILVITLLAGSVVGCAPKLVDPAPESEQASIGDPDWVWTESDGDAPQSGLAALIAQQAESDRAWLERQSRDADASPGGPLVRDSAPDLVIGTPISPAAHRSNDPTTPQPQDGLLRALSLAGGGPGVARNVPPPVTPASTPDEQPAPTEPTPDRGVRIAKLAGELAALLKEDAGESNDPARPLVAAALLESVAAGVLPEADLPGGGSLMLTEDERAALLSLRELAVRLVGDGSEIAGDPQRVRSVLLDAAEVLREHARIEIIRAELCTRAPGFGSYIPLERRTFLAGRTNRMVIYAEVDHFGLRPATEAEAAVEGDRVAADLKQEMELYLREGDPQPTWQRTVDWLPRTSRRGFRDLFVATPIELPATLSVGEYDLKIRIIDEVGGAQDEAVVPIRIVADASALESPPTDRQAGPTPPRSGSVLPNFASRARE